MQFPSLVVPSLGRAALVSCFVLCATAGIPLSWRKTAGGDAVIWVGFELLHRTYHLEISERRSQWIVSWAQKIVDSTSVNVSAFEEGLGRLIDVRGWSARVRAPAPRTTLSFYVPPSSKVDQVVSCLRQVLPVSPRSTDWNMSALSLRSGNTFVVHSPKSGRSGKRGEVWHWRLGSGEEHGRRAGSLAFAIVQLRADTEGLAVDVRERRPTISHKIDPGSFDCSCLSQVILRRRTQERTDQGTSCSDVDRQSRAALNKLLSTKFPSSAVVMELSCYLKCTSAKASFEWAPRTANFEADSLANGETHSFNPSRRIEVDVNSLGWEILQDALRMERQMEEDMKNMRASGISTNRGKKLRRRRQEDKMKVKDPW